MKTGTLFTVTSRMSLVGLFVLIGAFAIASTAAAQTDEACPLHASATPRADPPVTAQDVENGTGSLMDFTVAATEQFRTLSETRDLLHYLCVIRQEGGPWRSGSTYITSLSLDGRVFFHAKDMALTGRQLQPVIYGEILVRLGVEPNVLANLASPDPAVAGAAFTAVIQALSQGRHAPFDATVTIPGVRPGIPGASGYVGSYVSVAYGGQPFLALAGFDLDESHLVPIGEEMIDHGDPTITAADVVDRATLKAFVTQAGEYVLAQQRSGDPAASAKALVALRDENGPWRHGSVYLYVLNLTDPDADPPEGVILFHATEPDRLEFQPLVPTTRDVVTGEFILPQVLRAAIGNPEGGFIQYYYDDPTDHTDRADIPKVGYARQFTAEIQTPVGATQINFVVGSGFYLSSPGVVAASRNTVIESVLPQVVRAMTASTVDAVSGRIQQASAGTAADASLSFGGASTLSDAIVANGPALQNGTFDLTRLLQGSSFNLPLGGGGGGPFGDLTFWGSGDYRSLSGGGEQGVDYDGTVASANLGIDTRLSADVLAGVSLTSSQGSVDYADVNAQEGELSTSLISVSPYVGWGSSGGMSLWAMAGYGTGEVEIADAVGTDASDLTQTMFGVGASGSLMSSDRLIGGGTTSLLLKAEGAFTKAEVDGSETLESTTVNVSRQRLTLEGVFDQRLASGATLSPSLELGIRNDSGDGETGTGVETGGGLRYSDASSGLTVEGRARTLLSHSGDHEEWGVSGLVRFGPGASGQGLSFSLQPAWGQTASSVQRLWRTDVAALGALPAAYEGTGRVSAQLAYGIGDTWGTKGMLTPYTDVSFSDAGSRRLSLGGRYDVGPWVGMSLEGVLGRPAHGAADHSLMLRGNLHW